MAQGLPAGTKLGRYEVIKYLARGGMADLSVARARGIENFERHVVIKHLRPEQSGDAAFVQMFVTEARLAGVLHHHNIVQVHDIGQSEGRHFFAMEYVHGEDLRHVLSKLCDRNEQMPLQHIVTIATAVCAALHHAHEQRSADRTPLGIVHRDVTPGNILVSYDGNVKVVDFGIAKAVQRTSDTAAGMLKGKVPYMAPEQCTGKPIDRRSDVFAFGIVLYELCTVRRLFKGGNEYTTMAAVVQGEIPKPSVHRKDLPPELEQIIMKALRRDPKARYQTADEMRLALDRFADQAGLRTSTTALSDYMKKLFGEKPEPWMVDISPAVETPLNFDKTDVGVVPTPSEPSTPSKLSRGSLLAHARAQTAKPISSVTSKPPPPPLLKRAANADSEPVQIVAAEPLPTPTVTEVEVSPLDEPHETEPGGVTPPPAVTAVEVRAAQSEPTEIVSPLPLDVGDSTASTREATGTRTWLYLGGAAVVALGIAIVIMLTGRGPDAEATATPAEIAKPAVETRPVATPEPIAVEPVEPTLEPKPAQPIAEPTPIEPKPAPVVEPKPAPRPVVVEPPPKPVKKPVARKPPPKPKGPQWDPNSLFLKPKP